jgi:hypothetical protein
VNLKAVRLALYTFQQRFVLTGRPHARRREQTIAPAR